MIFVLYFYEVLQNIPHNVSGKKYIVRIISLLVFLQKMHMIIYTYRKKQDLQILERIIIGIWV